MRMISFIPTVGLILEIPLCLEIINRVFHVSGILAGFLLQLDLFRVTLTAVSHKVAVVDLTNCDFVVVHNLIPSTFFLLGNPR